MFKIRKGPERRQTRCKGSALEMFTFLVSKDQGDHRDCSKMGILVVRACGGVKRKNLLRGPKHRIGRGKTDSTHRPKLELG